MKVLQNISSDAEGLFKSAFGWENIGSGDIESTLTDCAKCLQSLAYRKDTSRAAALESLL